MRQAHFEAHSETHLLPTKLVIDTNVVLALWMFGDPGLNRLRLAIETGRYALLSRADALTELGLVLAYPQFGLSSTAQETVIARYRRHLHCLPALSADEMNELARLPQCADADDQKFIEIAWLGGASQLLTRDRQLLKTGRKRVLKARFETLSPEAFVQRSPENGNPQTLARNSSR